jgi:Tfp pilus assembly protein PilF
MSLMEIRDAALASQFESPEKLRSWLRVAIGDNARLLYLALYHTRRALLNGPLHGEGYVYLAELNFLDDNDAAAKHKFIDQALRLRPHSGSVLTAVGSEAALAGKPELAFQYWREAFRSGPVQQARLIRQLSGQVSPEFFVKTFQPDLSGLRQMFYYYQHSQADAQARSLAPYYARACLAAARKAVGTEAAEKWYEAHKAFLLAGDQARALACAAQAVKSSPNDYGLRYSLAMRYFEQQQYDSAVEQLRWCKRRRPDDSRVQRCLSVALRSSTPKR